MSKCLLCQEREATQKGSHIIPSFFMKRINSIDGCNKRDHELGFSIGLGTIETYFGREVFEDRRKEYTDDERRMEDRTNLDTMDNVFCPICERLFSKYESKYSQTYDIPFEKNYVENTKVTGVEAALLWFSIIWRISATEHYKLRLNPDFEEKLRVILLSENVNDREVYYALNYCKEYRKENPTFVFFDCADNAAMLIVDEFMIILFNGTDAIQSNELLLGMKLKCDMVNLNDGVKPEMIALFPVKIFQQINNNILYRHVRHFDLKGLFNTMHIYLFGREMPNDIFAEVIAEIQKAKLADMYTIHNYARAMEKVIQTHLDLYRLG